MAHFFRKIQMAIAALAIASTCNAQQKDDFYTLNPSCEQACTPECCCPPACGKFFLGGSLLYLRAFEGNLSSVCDNTEITDFDEDGLVISRLEGKAHDPDFNWNLGYRVEAGYEFANSQCGLGASWLHFNSHTHGNKNHKNRPNWKINLDVVDAIFACECDLSTCFSLVPYGGIRYARIDQKLRTNFLSTESSDLGELFRNSRGHLKEDFQGVGGLFGLEGDWTLGCGFSLYGNISAGVLYGTFHVRSNKTEEFDTGINIDHLRKHTQACQLVTDTGFGVRWKTSFWCDKTLLVQLGLEQHRYFNHNQFCGYGDLNLDGASLNVAVEF